MKTSRLAALALPLALTSAVAVGGCTDLATDDPIPEIDEPIAEPGAGEHGAHLFAYNAEHSPSGISMSRWGELWWKWIFAQPAAHNPIFDTTGADCGVGDQGGVFFLASVVDPGGPAVVNRSCAVPAQTPILISPSGSLNDFPCPDPSFQPAPGQSMFGFLKAGIAPLVNSVNLIEITLDGVALPGTLAYRFTSRDAFHITGDPSLATSLDGCITGTPQDAVSDGYFTMLRGLSSGTHTLVIRARDDAGTDVTINWTLDAGW